MEIKGAQMINIKSQLFLLIMIFSLTGCTTIKAIMLVNSGEVVSGDHTESVIPFEAKGPGILIKARLNDSQKNYNFIVDTAALTVITQQVATELNLHDGIEVEMKDSAGKTKKIQLIKLKDIIVKNAQVKECAAAIIDPTEQFGPNLGIDGILGSNFFKHFKVIIDYQNKRITFSHDTKPVVLIDNEIKIPFETDMKMGFAPKIKCVVNDDIKGTGIIDTGTPAMADLPFSMMKKTKSFQEGAVLTSNGGMSFGLVGWADKSYLLRVDKINIGNLRLVNVPSISHYSKDDNILFGNKFLSKFLVTLNYPAGEMVLKPNGTPFETNIPSYGLALAKKENRTVASGIWNNSSADRNSIKPGDEIVTVDSKNPNELSMFDLMTLFTDEKVNAIEVEFINDKGRQKAELHKEMLLPALQ
jgi:hypothetical protein